MSDLAAAMGRRSLADAFAQPVPDSARAAAVEAAGVVAALLDAMLDLSQQAADAAAAAYLAGRFGMGDACNPVAASMQYALEQRQLFGVVIEVLGEHASRLTAELNPAPIIFDPKEA